MQVLYDDGVWYGGVLEAGPEFRDGDLRIHCRRDCSTSCDTVLTSEVQL